MSQTFSHVMRTLKMKILLIRRMRACNKHEAHVIVRKRFHQQRQRA